MTISKHGPNGWNLKFISFQTWNCTKDVDRVMEEGVRIKLDEANDEDLSGLIIGVGDNHVLTDD